MLTYPIGTLSKKGVDNSFKLTINTALGTGTTFTLPLPSGQTYDFYWTPYTGATPLHVTAYDDANATYDYGVHGTYNVSIGVNTGDKCGGWSFNNGGDKLKITSVDQWGDTGFDYLAGGFYGCSNLISLECTNANMTSINSLNRFISGCTSLTSLDCAGWDVSNVTDLTYFAQNSGLSSISVPDWDTSSCTIALGFIYGCNSLVSANLQNWDLSLCLNASFFAYSCGALTSLNVSNWNTSGVQNLSYFISLSNNLTSIDVTGWDTSNVTNLQRFARNCTSLVTFDTSNWDTLNVTNCDSMCSGCTSLTTNFDNTLWWDRTIPIASYSLCFFNATNIGNYASIPNDWKGL